MHRSSIAVTLLLSIRVASAQTATGDTLTLSATAHGNYTNLGGHSQSNSNYFVGRDSLDNTVYRNFFVFNLAPVTKTIINATFDAYNPPGSNAFFSQFVLRDVSTPVSDLIQSHGNAVAIYEDLGSGSVFGTRLPPVENGSFVSVALNSDAIASLNASLGNSWAVGGALAPEIGDLFAHSSFEPSHLILELVPEPSPLALAAFALIGLAAAAWRKRRTL